MRVSRFLKSKQSERVGGGFEPPPLSCLGIENEYHFATLFGENFSIKFSSKYF